MKEVFQHWLASRTLLSGVHACCVRFPDRTGFSQSFDGQISSDRLDQAWNTVAELLPALNKQRLTASHLVWCFERGDLHYVLRPDGTALGLYTEPRAGELPALRELIRDFLGLAEESPAE